MQRYQPSHTPADSWSKILELEESLGADLAPMAGLVRHIISSGLAERLFAYTSHFDLTISNRDPINWAEGSLKVTFDPVLQMADFEYRPVPGKPLEFIRHYPAAQLIEKFDQFVKWIRW
jgi:hypothetical protein